MKTSVAEPHLADAPQLAVQVAVGLDVYLYRLRAGLGELLEVEVGTRHHEMHVAVEAGRDALRERHYVRPEREVGHEVRVHDVEVERLGAGCLRTENLVRQPPEVGGQQRRQYVVPARNLLDGNVFLWIKMLSHSLPPCSRSLARRPGRKRPDYTILRLPCARGTASSVTTDWKRRLVQKSG